MWLKSKPDELVLARRLSQNFIEFKEFYEHERGRAGQIVWRIDSNLEFKIPGAHAASRTHPDTGIHEICLTKYPVDSTDAFVVAHEIMHSIFKEENTSLLIRNRGSRFANVNNYLSTMLEDYSVDLFLHKNYHFDLSKEYVRRLFNIKPESCIEPIDSLERLESAIFLTTSMIKWRLIDDSTAERKWNKFLNDYKRVCPKVFSMSCCLEGLAKKLETLEERRDAFINIVKNCQIYNEPLEKFLYLDNN